MHHTRPLTLAKINLDVNHGPFCHSRPLKVRTSLITLIMVKFHSDAHVLRPSVDHADSAVTVGVMDPLCTIHTMTVQISAAKKIQKHYVHILYSTVGHREFWHCCITQTLRIWPLTWNCVKCTKVSKEKWSSNRYIYIHICIHLYKIRMNANRSHVEKSEGTS